MKETRTRPQGERSRLRLLNGLFVSHFESVSIGRVVGMSDK